VESNQGQIISPDDLQALMGQIIPPNGSKMVWEHHSGAELLELMAFQVPQQRSWIMRNKALSLMLLVLLIALAEPAVAAALPPELRHYLSQDQGALTLAAAFIAAIGAMSDAHKKD
jgi:hypothetical protein